MVPTDVVVISVIGQAVTCIGAVFAVSSIYLRADRSIDAIRKAAGRGLSGVAIGALIQGLTMTSLLISPGVAG